MDKIQNFNFLMQVVKSLSRSQGLYCRILNAIEEQDEESRDTFIQNLPDFKNDSLNVVFFFEQ